MKLLSEYEAKLKELRPNEEILAWAFRFLQNGIVVQCWYPLGGRGYTADLLGNETIQMIAKTHGVSAAQVILRWDL